MNPTHSKPFILQIIFFFLTLHSLPYANPISNNNLVFKTCSNQKTFLTTPTYQSHSQALSSLFKELVSQSSNSKFFKTTQLSVLDDQTAISGLFQCRQDISNLECLNCVSTATNVCHAARSARVQLGQCYIRYEPEELVLDLDMNHYSSSSSSPALLHKTCGPESSQGSGLGAMRDAALLALEDSVVEQGGFCKIKFELVQAVAQCEGEMEACECGLCVNKAVELAQEECGGSVSAEIYLEKCFLSYSYYPQGVTEDGENRGRNDSNSGINMKILAIVIGGAAALGFGFIFLLFIKSRTKKDDDDDLI